jgi:hypothetical protein
MFSDFGLKTSIFQSLLWSGRIGSSFRFPSLTKIEGSALDNFQMHFERRLPESRRLIVNSLAVTPQVEGRTAVVLDLNVVWQGEPIDHAKVPEILERVHP